MIEAASLRRIVVLRIVASYASVRAITEQHKAHLRTAAYILALQRVAEAAMTRGIYP
jgi:glutamate dehydrogenase/leucine dehydrogenase